MVIKAFRRRLPDFNHPADLVWAAASAAYRINGGYWKNEEIRDGRVVTPRNRDLVRLYLADSSHQFITDGDYSQGQQCRAVLAADVTMSALKGDLNEWDRVVHEMVNLDRITTDYQVSVITALPKAYNTLIHRTAINDRLGECDATPVGRVDDRVTLSGEIVRVSYSNRFNTYYTTVITDSNQEVYFAYRERLATTRRIRFCGRVKRHAGRATQLSRVKLLEQEVV